MLAAFEHFSLDPFTRQDLCAAVHWPISTVCGRAFTLLERGALEECGRRGRSALLRIVIKQPRRRK